MIKNIRLLNQQLVEHNFDAPEDIVSWMGAVQAQDFDRSKWALGIRMKTPSLASVQQALTENKIIRTHILRPTWHYVAAKDIRWMIKLTGNRLKASVDAYKKKIGLPESLEKKYTLSVVKVLEGGKNHTKQEIITKLERQGLQDDGHLVYNILFGLEVTGQVCGGADKGGKHSYALLDECIPPCAELNKEEALAELALRYFQSHSPATLTDFTWWSGLTATEARKAVASISSELITETFDEKEFYIHRSCRTSLSFGDTVHLLPPFDEYLISYKDRTPVLDLEHHPKAFNNFGIFYPVVSVNGKVVGNWNVKKGKKNSLSVETSFFEDIFQADKEAVEAAIEKYTGFFG